MTDKITINRPKVFVSHSSSDKPFVRRLVEDLKSLDIPVWFDESDIFVGDSIVQKIDSALSESDYLIVVLSEASVKSAWVQNELDFALMEEKSKSIVILPVKIDNCEVPALLRARLYADFSVEYQRGFDSLKKVFLQEKVLVSSHLEVGRGGSSCEQSLSQLSDAELRRRLKKLSRSELATVWFDLFGARMDDDMHGRTLMECVIELLLRASSRNKMKELIESVCSERADLANPN